MTQKHRLHELGSLRVGLLLLLGMVGITLFCIMGIMEYRYQLMHGIINESMAESLPGMILLCAVLGIIIFGVINYFLIIRPIQKVEDLVDSYIQLATEADDRILLENADQLTIRIAFSRLVNREKLTVRVNKSLEREHLSNELHALQARINPHFLYNTLDCIRGLALLRDAWEIADLTEALAHLFRSMVLPEGKLLKLRQEVENIRDYVKIQKFRFNDNFEYICDINETLLDRYRILNMTLQPIVENAIMHGLEQKVGMGTVRVSATVSERRLLVMVEDNGVGISAEKVKALNNSFTMGVKFYSSGGNRRNNGIGLATINRRIKLKFGDKYGLHVASTPGVQTITEVVLPLIGNND